MTAADEVGRPADCVRRPLSHLLAFDHHEEHAGPICRICGAWLTQDHWLDDHPCPGPIDLYQVVADLHGPAYLGREKREELAMTLRRAIGRMTSEAIPGPTCEPPAIHIFLNGGHVCECGEIDDRWLVDAVTREPITDSTCG